MNPLARIGKFFLSFLAHTGRLAIFIAQSFLAIIQPPYYLRLIGQQMIRIGYFSLPVVALTSFFTGGVLALQIYYGGNQFNSEAIVSSIVALGITRELGPVLGGLMVAGRVSAAIAAEIGTMRVTEQIDALTTLSTEPFKYLVATRVIAAVLSMPLLALVADIIGIMGGFVVGTQSLGFNPAIYMQLTIDFITPDDIEYQLKILEKSSDDLILGVRYSQKRKIDYLTFWSRTKKIGFIDICKVLSHESINIFSARLAELKSNLHVYTLEINRFGNSTFNDRKIWNRIKKNIESENLSNKDNEKNHFQISNYKSTLKAKVKVDNDLSSKFSIIELTAGDKPGMLYSILRKIKDLGLRIRFVKISTKRESVEDVFYVTKGSKGKIFDMNEIENIKENIMDVIE